jgi:ubiquinol-cytochrome c reductase cytochrome b subunit|tara:strand:- start:27381 stop:29408 length:2028 start_codon:yes stop_codon:yes gene_type:complete
MLIALRDWIDARLPIMRAWNTHMAKYYAPKNFNFWYYFGVLSLVVLIIQLVSGIWLLMSFEGSSERAFASVEYIMRDVDYGWIIRYIHSTGASAFFMVIYLHMFRGLIYGSYKPPRELVWIFGMTIYVALMAEAFMGYVLPWGQMSFWGAQVIISLFGAIPVIGEDIVQWVRGDYLISGITLNRFMSLHVVALPIILLALVVLHLLALHEVGSNNPDGVDIKKNKDENGVPRDGIPFHPYYTVHDLVPITVFLFVFCFILFFMPEMGGYFLEYANFEIANPLKTPEHIAPVWYFTPFYSMLRAVPDKFAGFLVMAAAIAILFVLPWLDRSPVRSMRYKGSFSRGAILVFAASFVVLGVLGVKAPTPERTLLAQICTGLYFLFFFAMPFWTRIEKTKPVPERVTMDGGMGPGKTILALSVVMFLIWAPLKAVGAESTFKCGAIPCDEFTADLSDKSSLQNGAKSFVNYCMGCHSAKYSRWDRVAKDLGIPADLAKDNLIHADQKFGALMNISMPSDKAKAWFGATPPDLTLVARSRSPEWLYTYLRNFYSDPSRPLGVNNKVFKDVGMPHVLLDLQGLQECAPGPVLASNGGIKRDIFTREEILENPCGRYNIVSEGSLSPEEFDTEIYDLVNFLAYIAEPMAEDRKRIGTYALLFLAFLFIWVWLLNREYWKDIH